MLYNQPRTVASVAASPSQEKNLMQSKYRVLINIFGRIGGVMLNFSKEQGYVIGDLQRF